MITSRVTEQQLAEWKQICARKRKMLRPNRISGEQLDAYFREKYAPKILDDPDFRDVVYQNAREESPESISEDIRTYALDGGLVVGIDLRSGFFHVECEETERAAPVWDDLFLHRGLNETDLDNYVITGQYLQMIDRLP